jgi:hypothetical protein
VRRCGLSPEKLTRAIGVGYNEQGRRGKVGVCRCSIAITVCVVHRRPRRDQDEQSGMVLCSRAWRIEGLGCRSAWNVVRVHLVVGSRWAAQWGHDWLGPGRG